MRRFLNWALLAGMVLLACSVGAAGGARKKKASPKKGTAASTARSRKQSASRRPAVTWRNRQLKPTPERCREIQQALSDKGYLRREEATGVWGDSSADALKRFQADQNLDPSGRINSLSLIALGLGPKREPPPAAPPVRPAPDAFDAGK